MAKAVCSRCVHCYTEQWAKNMEVQRCGASGHMGSGWAVHQYPVGKAFLVEDRPAPAWCERFESKEDEHV